MISLSRKQSYDEYSEAEECCSLLFPRYPEQINANIQALKRCYSPNQHAFLLINLAYRCPDPTYARPYTQFIINHHPEIASPKLSTLYPNESFPDLLAFYEATEGRAEVLHIPPLSKNLKSILDQLFNDNGYVPSLERFLLFYPAYLEKHLIAETELLEGGKIDQKLAYFLALAGAAEHGCVYMMGRYLKRYFKSGGQLEWLTEGRYPRKLRPILRLNHKMSHGVWEITPDMILDILEDPSFRWSINELAVIIQILAFAHNDATIALALGLLPEEPQLLTELSLTKIMEMKAEYDEKCYDASGEQLQRHEDLLEVVQQMEQGREGEDEEYQACCLARPARKTVFLEPYMREIGNELISKHLYMSINALLQPLLEPYESGERKSEISYPPIDYSDYNYKFMAYPILNNLTGSLADRLQSLIEHAEAMTLGNFGSQIIRHTKQFRKSVRYYGENLCGYTHQGYDYKKELTAMLTVPLKFYIRLLMLSPLHINRQVLKEIQHEGGQIECFDLGHIAILAATAKMTLELTLTVQAFEL